MTVRTSKNYDNRRVDINIYEDFNFARGDMERVNTGLSINRGGFVLAGIAKLAQSVVIAFLTDDVFFDQFWGSAIPQDLFNSNLQGVVQQFDMKLTQAVEVVESQLSAAEYDGQPADERMGTLDIVSWDYNDAGDGLIVNLQVTSATGSTQEVILPLNVSLV